MKLHGKMSLDLMDTVNKRRKQVIQEGQSDTDKQTLTPEAITRNEFQTKCTKPRILFNVTKADHTLKQKV